MREFSNELRKIVIKVGSSSVSHENGGVDIERIEELAKEIVNLENKGIKVILVSSGAIATGANRLNVKRPRNDISKKQATAAVGQVDEYFPQSFCGIWVFYRADSSYKNGWN